DGIDTVDYGDATSSVSVDVTDTNAQNTGGGGVDTLSGIEGVRGSAYSDTFSFDDPEDGAVYHVDGAAGYDTIRLTGYDIADAVFSNGRITIDPGTGFSFAIDYSDVTYVQFGDVTAMVLSGNGVLTNFNGTATYIQGASAFTVGVAGAGSANGTYYAASNSIDITSNSLTSNTTAITVFNHRGSTLGIGSVTTSGTIGSLTSNVDISDVTFTSGTSRIDTITVDGGAGTIGSITYTGAIDTGSTVTIDANVGTFSATRHGSSTVVNITGDVGTYRVHDSDPNTTTDELAGTLDITGDLGTLDVGDGISGTVQVQGDVTTVTVGRDLDLGGTLSVGGDLTTATFADDIDGTMTVTGSVGSLTVIANQAGNVTVGASLTTATIGTLGGDLQVTGNAGTIYLTSDSLPGSNLIVGGDLTELRVDDNLDGTVTITGSVTTIEAQNASAGTIDIGGDLDSATFTTDYTGNLTADQVVGTLSIIDGAFSYAPTYSSPRVVTYDGSANAINGAPTDIVFDSEDTNEQVVNAYTTDSQLDVATAAFADGGWISVWQSNAQDGSGFGIYAQRFHADGTTNGAEFRVNTMATNSQTRPTVTTFADGGFAIAWQDGGNGSSSVEVRVFDATATAVSNDVSVKSGGINTSNEAYNPTVMALDANRFLVVYNDENASVTSVTGQLFDRNGGKIGGAIDIGTLQGDYGQWLGQPDVSLLANGGFAVAWYDDDDAGTNPQNRLRLFDSTGVASSPEIVLGGDGQADVATLGNGNIAVIYGNAGQLSAQILDATGATVVAQFDIGAFAAGADTAPSITALSNGGFVVAWESATADGDGQAILAQRFDDGGIAITDPFLINQTTAGNQIQIELIELANGELRASWASQNVDGSSYAIVSRTIATAGSVAENASNGTVVARVTDVTDATTSDTHTFSLDDDAGGRFSIDVTTGVITVADGTLLDYETATTHDIVVRATDALGDYHQETVTITLSDIDDPLTVAATGTALSYSENGGAVAVDPALVVSDPDTLIEGVTVQFEAGFTPGEDTLAFTAQAGISGSFNATTGVLTLSGAAAAADYQAVLRTVTYTNTSDNPSTTTRLVRFDVAQGATITSASRSITVEAVNDDPTNAGTAPGSVVVTEDARSDVDLTSIVLQDLDDDGQSVTVTISTVSGGNLWATAGPGVTVTGAGTDTVTLVGTISDLNTVFGSGASFEYQHPTADTAGSAADTIRVTVNDGGNTGTGGGGDVLLETVTVDITGVNDAPVRTAGSVDDLTLAEDAGMTPLGLADIAYGSGGGADENGQTLTFEITTIPDPNGFGKIFLADGTTQVTTGFYSLEQLRGMQFESVANENGTSFFSYRVVDDGGTTNGGSDALSESIRIDVTAVDDAPTASAGPDQTVLENSVVTLDATATTDVDSPSLNYTWTQTSGPSVTLSDANATQPTFTAPEAAGSYTLSFQ
ncbi:MAG: cadherin repeat domain-containing protein, partial [Planctomycetes bacterium]|nr:cadherin repeat domain-containing protein [Planctomycetota bacterium]